METKKIVMGVISVAVAIIVLMSMIPIFTDAGASEDTFTNDEYFITMDKMDASSEHTITWAKETSSKITVDGVEVSPDWNSVTIVAEEDNLIRCSKSTTPGSNEYYLNMVGTATAVGYGNISDKSVTVTISGGTITFAGVTASDNTYSASSTFTDGYCITTGDEFGYVMKTPTAKAYVLGDSEIYGIGYSAFGGAWQNIFSISGTIDDGIDVSLISTTLDDPAPTISDETTYSTKVSGFEDLYQFEKVTFNANYNDTATPLTYSYVIVPAEVTAERSVHASPVEATLIGLIPLLMMVGIMLTAIGLFITRYRKN